MIKKVTKSVSLSGAWSTIYAPTGVKLGSIIQIRPSDGYGNWISWRASAIGDIRILRYTESNGSITAISSSETLSLDFYYI